MKITGSKMKKIEGKKSKKCQDHDPLFIKHYYCDCFWWLESLSLKFMFHDSASTLDSCPSAWTIISIMDFLLPGTVTGAVDRRERSRMKGSSTFPFWVCALVEAWLSGFNFQFQLR